jgi:hypothetical protein
MVLAKEKNIKKESIKLLNIYNWCLLDLSFSFFPKIKQINSVTAKQ